MTLNLFLQRKLPIETCTHGDLFVNGKHECVTLEDVVRDKKIYARTAIPHGTYDVIVTRSPRFNRLLPILIDVPGFEGVRIHTGNSSEDTAGCVLVGMFRPSEERDWISNSRIAFNSLFQKITLSLDHGEDVKLTIRNAKEEDG